MYLEWKQIGIARNFLIFINTYIWIEMYTQYPHLLKDRDPLKEIISDWHNVEQTYSIQSAFHSKSII